MSSIILMCTLSIVHFKDLVQYIAISIKLNEALSVSEDDIHSKSSPKTVMKLIMKAVGFLLLNKVCRFVIAALCIQTSSCQIYRFCLPS